MIKIIEQNARLAGAKNKTLTCSVAILYPLCKGDRHRKPLGKTKDTLHRPRSKHTAINQLLLC